MEKYSFLTSVYYKEKPENLRLSIESMLNQTAAPDQIVLVKDGKLTAELDAVIDEFAAKYPEVFTIITLEENKGLANALNAGLKECRNELVARMDSDDVSVKERCALSLAEFEKDTDLGLLGTGMYTFVGSPDNVIGERYQPADFNKIKKALRRNDPFFHPTVMYKKSLVLASGGYAAELRRRQDYDLFSKMVNDGVKATNIEKPLLYFRTTDDYYLRNKNKESCVNRIIVQKRIYRRKECSFFDYLYVKTVFTAVRFMPLWLYKLLYKKIKK